MSHLVLPHTSVLDDSIACPLWFGARGEGACHTIGGGGGGRGRGRGETSPIQEQSEGLLCVFVFVYVCVTCV